MRTIEAAAYFGSVQKLADALGITRQAIWEWRGEVPELRAYQLEVLTEGALKATPKPQDAA